MTGDKHKAEPVVAVAMFAAQEPVESERSSTWRGRHAECAVVVRCGARSRALATQCGTLLAAFSILVMSVDAADTSPFWSVLVSPA
tara:strand:+ start:2506 stop:2763 length:258 start_codon:yes stop_codon:yes gene_type:complete